MIYILSGSQRPDMGRLRQGIKVLKHLYPSDVVELRLGPVGEHLWLDGPPMERFNTFKALLSSVALHDVIVMANGGTGAARATRYFDLGDPPERRNPLIMGSSDAMVYPLMAWLWGSDQGYYGPNAVDTDMAQGPFWTSTDGDADNLMFQSAELVGSGFEWSDHATAPYTVVPACSGTLRQVSASVRKSLQDRLIDTPSILMLEDNYPQNEMGALALYEDLTMLYDIVQALNRGGGILTVNSVHGGAQVLEDYKTLFPELPMVGGVDFGHSGPLDKIIQYGASANITYNPLSGLGINME